jgi:putative phosphoesterase
MPSFLLGLISDTHGLLRPEALAALENCQAILHAGDVGDTGVLDRLKSIAPVYAVRGNVDTAPWAQSLRLTETVRLAGTSIHILHNLEELDIVPESLDVRIIVSGHTHQPDFYWRGGVLYLNPGSAGPRRFSLPTTVGRMDLLGTPWRPEFRHLACKTDH